MRIAVPFWDNRISPVFDVAQTLLLLEVRNGKLVEKKSLSIIGMSPPEKVGILKNCGVNRVLCGAISDILLNLLRVNDISVYPWNSGEVNEVIQAALQNRLSEPRFCMPGCCHRRRRWGWDQD